MIRASPVSLACVYPAMARDGAEIFKIEDERHEGEGFDVMSVRRWRDRALGQAPL